MPETSSTDPSVEYTPIDVYRSDNFFQLSPSTANDLGLSGFVRDEFGDQRSGEMLAFFKRPLIDREAISRLREVQDEIMRNDELFSIFDGVAEFLFEIQKSTRSFLGLAAGVEMATERGENPFLRTASFVQTIGETRDSAEAFRDRIDGLEKSGNIFSEITQTLLNNIKKFFSALLAELNKVDVKIQKKNRLRFRSSNKITLRHDDFRGQEFPPANQHVIAHTENKLSIVCRDFVGIPMFQDQSDTPYWLLVLTAMAAYRRKYQTIIGQALMNGDDSIFAENVHNPHQTLLTDAGSVPVGQPCLVFEPDDRLIILTGPNSAGKTFLMRSIVQLMIHHQLGSDVFGSNASLPIVKQFLSYQASTGPSQDFKGRLLREFRELKGICDEAGPGTLVMIDEFLQGIAQIPCVAEMAGIIVGEMVKKGARVLMASHNPDIVENLSHAKGSKVLVTDIGADSKPTYVFTPVTTGVTDAFNRDSYEARAWSLFEQAGFKRPAGEA